MQRIAGDRPKNMMNRTWGIDPGTGGDSYIAPDKCPQCGKPYIYVGDWFGSWPPPICVCAQRWWGGRKTFQAGGLGMPKL